MMIVLYNCHIFIVQANVVNVQAARNNCLLGHCKNNGATSNLMT